MAKVLFKRRTTAEIEDLEVEDGALIYNTDNGKTYMDFEEERIQTGGNADTIIARQTTEPTDEDIKLWINPDKLAETEASNVVDSMEGTQTDKSPSVNAVKEYIEDAEVYSTDEAKTNKVWIDGKPIYRKVISGNFNGVKETKAVNISENIDTFIGIEESAIKIEGTAYAPIPYTSASGYYKIGFSYITTGYAQIDASNNGTNPYDFRLVVLYTKTTD